MANEMLVQFREADLTLDEIRTGIQELRRTRTKILKNLEPGDTILQLDLAHTIGILANFLLLCNEEKQWLESLIEGLDKFAHKYSQLFEIKEFGEAISRVTSYIRRVLYNNNREGANKDGS